MQELTFEQVEEVSGGLASNGSDAPITNITDIDQTTRSLF
jgi:hypothetical protein